MTDEQYIGAQSTLKGLGLNASLHDWKGFIKRADSALTMGPFVIAPPQYQEAAPILQRLKKMAQCADEIAQLHKEIREKSWHSSNSSEKPQNASS